MVKSKQCFHIESIHCLRINTLYILRYELPKISNSFNKFDEMFFQEFVSRFFQWIFLPHILKPLFKDLHGLPAWFTWGKRSRSPSISRGYFTCGFPPPRPKTCQPKRVWRLNSCRIASKWRRNICWGPGPRIKVSMGYEKSSSIGSLVSWNRQVSKFVYFKHRRYQRLPEILWYIMIYNLQ